jgi:hypothetical protein
MALGDGGATVKRKKREIGYNNFRVGFILKGKTYI